MAPDIAFAVPLTEAFQLEAALTDRLAVLARAEVRATPGTLEADAVADAVRWTGAALTRLQLALYGADEPDEPVWDLPDAIDAAKAYADWTSGELVVGFGR